MIADGKRTGEGTIYLKNGAMLSGNYKNGKLDGKATYTDGGKKTKRVYKHGVCIKDDGKRLYPAAEFFDDGPASEFFDNKPLKGFDNYENVEIINNYETEDEKTAE